MAVFRVAKNKGYTVMSNYHLNDKSLTLKAKGLLSQMLSLPDTWDFTLRGLAHINKESIDAIRTAVLELEQNGYITRQQGRNAGGKLTTIERNRRTIRVKLKHDDGKLGLEVINPCAEPVEFDDRGLPVTHQAGHGIGVRSIAAVAEQNDYMLHFNYAGGKFVMRLIITDGVGAYAH